MCRSHEKIAKTSDVQDPFKTLKTPFARSICAVLNVQKLNELVVQIVAVQMCYPAGRRVEPGSRSVGWAGSPRPRSSG